MTKTGATRMAAIALMLAGTGLVAGCGRQAPSGQVAATVNGNEVTRQEINTELQSANVPPGADKQQVQNALLQQVIDRKLLIQAARDKGIDKTPDFIAQQHRTDEMLLAQAYVKQQAAAMQPPSPAEIDTFMRDRPNMFANREQLAIDQIRFPASTDRQLLAALEAAKTQDAVAAALTRFNVRFDRGTALLDTASLDPKAAGRINALPAGAAFIVPTPQGLTSNVITGRRAVPTDMIQARAAATAAWRQQRLGDILKRQLDTLKGNAKIDYQAGFGPAKPARAPAGAAAGK